MREWVSIMQQTSVATNLSCSQLSVKRWELLPLPALLDLLFCCFSISSPTPGIRDYDLATSMEAHNHYTRRKKRFSAMEPNTKLLMEELMKQVQDKISEGFAAHMEATTQRFAVMAVADLERDDWVAGLEEAAAAFSAWKPEVEASLSSVKLEVLKLNSFFACDSKNPEAPQTSILSTRSASKLASTGFTPAGFAIDGPNGHHNDNSYRDCRICRR
jgi:hypothetical protein